MQDFKDDFAVSVEAWGEWDTLFLSFEGGGEVLVEDRRIHVVILSNRVEE